MTGPGAPAGDAGATVTARAVAAVARFGPFFAAEAHDAARPPGDPWRPMDELVTDEGVLTARVAAVRASLAVRGGPSGRTVPWRVAASVAHLGLTARLVSPFLALTAVTGLPCSAELAALRWQPVTGGVLPLSVPCGPGGAAGPYGLLEGPVRDLVDAFAARSVSRRVLWGNVASAVRGAAVAARAGGAPGASAVGAAARAWLAAPVLEGTYETRGGFRRRSCCLIYRALPGGYCGDCVLGPVRHRRPEECSGSRPGGPMPSGTFPPAARAGGPAAGGRDAGQERGTT